MLLKKLLCAVLAFAPVQLLAAAQADAETWLYSLGFGVFSVPAYLGADTNREATAPILSASYGDRLFASSIGGVGYRLMRGERWKLGVIAKYHEGRQEDGDSPYFIDDESSNDLLGLGDIEGSVELGGFVEYSSGRYSGKFELRQAVSGHEGAVGEAELKISGRSHLLGRPGSFSIGPKISLADADYVNAFFGVNRQQSAASGLGEFEFVPEDDELADGLQLSLLSYGLHGSIAVPLTRALSVVGFAAYDQIANAVADSPLIDTRGSQSQQTLGIYLVYSM